ncbi:hypothetical protein [Clostridium intestinale]|uniref:Uncharacterized protein n=1 Tax=Clostridium intestinale URNW TaxID=1294142 RepID=U2NJE7_9CLOT|nr:hypothetical protein [Clostridium intestinale]ERK29278.1 hypothetical protein CINTURNW_3455 [Clostridium intestinale URNW]
MVRKLLRRNWLICIVAWWILFNINSEAIAGEITTYSDSTNYKDDRIEPQIKIPINLEIEKEAQKNVEEGHSPWKLDPVFVAQVFVSLQVSPEGITGDYPIHDKELKIIQTSEIETIVEVNSNKTKIKKVYLKRLIKKDSSGIWTVVGYDSE